MIKQFLGELTTSERHRLFVASLLILVLLIYILIWTPLIDQHRALNQTLQQKQQLLRWMEASASIVASNNTPRETLDTASLQRLVSSRARYHKIEISRLQSMTNGRVQLHIDHLSFNTLLDFVAFLNAKGAILDQASIKQLDSSGSVSTGLTFKTHT